MYLFVKTIIENYHFLDRKTKYLAFFSSDLGCLFKRKNKLQTICFRLNNIQYYLIKPI